MNSNPKGIAVDFDNPADVNHPGIRIPKGCRVFSIAGTPVVVPGAKPNTTRLFVHSEADEAMLRSANS